MYVKTALIQLNNDHSFKLTGDQAQRVYDSCCLFNGGEQYKYPNQFIELEVNEKIFIPGNSIAFIGFIENQEANLVDMKIEAKWDEIEEITGFRNNSVYTWFVEGDSVYRQPKPDYFHFDPSHPQEIEPVSSDPLIVNLLREIQDLEDQLEKLLEVGEEHAIFIP